MLAVAFLLFTFAGLILFIVDGIIAPTVCDHLRFRVFAIRDEVRRSRMQNKISEEDYRTIEQDCHVVLRAVPRITLPELVAIRVHTQKVISSMQELPAANPPVSDYRRRLLNRILQATVANSSAWIVMILPVYLVYKASMRFFGEWTIVTRIRELASWYLRSEGSRLQPSMLSRRHCPV